MTETTWAGLGLAGPLVETLDRAGFKTPSPIQAQAIPAQLERRDLLGLAETGSGKTAAFLLPILEQLAADGPRRPKPGEVRALVLVPTRELAAQIEETAKRLTGPRRLSTQLVLGGMSRSAQVRSLARGVDIVIATPGRLTDLIASREARLDETGVLVLDEADRLLDMGFAPQVKRIAAQLMRGRRTALFSATMPQEVEALAAGLMRDPVRVEVARSGHTVPKIEQSVEMVEREAKRARLAEILSAPGMERAIVFTRTKHNADRVAKNLDRDGIEAGAIHGNKSQNARQRVLDAFRSGRLRVLVASDIAARGIDVVGVTHVVQYEMPDEPEAYVHRIGRTGRNGAEGVAIALCSAEELSKLRAVEKLTRRRLVEGDAGSAGPAAPARALRRTGGGGGAPRPQGKPMGKPAAKGAGKPGGANGAANGAGAPGEAPKRRRRPRRRVAA